MTTLPSPHDSSWDDTLAGAIFDPDWREALAPYMTDDVIEATAATLKGFIATSQSSIDQARLSGDNDRARRARSFNGKAHTALARVRPALVAYRKRVNNPEPKVPWRAWAFRAMDLLDAVADELPPGPLADQVEQLLKDFDAHDTTWADNSG